MSKDYHNYFMTLLKQLVSISSSSQKEEACAAFLVQFLKDELGMNVRFQRVKGAGGNVVGTLKGSGRTAASNVFHSDSSEISSERDQQNRSILLGGHIDTVKSSNQWKRNPFQLTIEGDRAYGLGAADMKGGMAAQITVLKRMVDERLPFCGEIQLIALCDEERYSAGANDYVKLLKSQMEAGLIHRPEFAVLAEPHFDNIVAGAAGKALFSMEVQGETGHGANPETGVNAIDTMVQFLNAINETYTPLYERGDSASHCVLQIRSQYDSYSLNIPDRCNALLNKQLNVEENAENFQLDLQALYAKAVGKGKLHITRQIPYYPSYQIDENNPDVQRLMGLLKNEYGMIPKLKLNQSVSDGNILYTELGIPTVLFGPRGQDYHKPNEYLELSTAFQYMDILYRYLMLYFS